LLADGITEEAVSFVAFRTSMEGFANTTTIGALPAVAVVYRLCNVDIVARDNYRLIGLTLNWLWLDLRLFL
jgi:hypothetical protein